MKTACARGLALGLIGACAVPGTATRDSSVRLKDDVLRELAALPPAESPPARSVAAIPAAPSVAASGGSTAARPAVAPTEAPPPISRYGDRTYRRATALDSLKEIESLPAALAADLHTLITRAAEAAAVVPDTDTAHLRVRYFSGVNHPCHGLLENGVGEISGDPPAGTWLKEHCFDRDGRLVKAIGRAADGTRSVSRTFLYDGDRPAGMLTFGPDGYSFGDYGLYRDGRLSLVARIDPSGRVVSCECIFWTENREDYSVRYVARRTPAPFRVSDLRLDSLQFRGWSRLTFDESGALNRVWCGYPDPCAPE